MAGLVSVLTSVGTGAATGTGPSLTNAETLADTTIVAVSAPADVAVTLDAEPTEYDGFASPISDH